jgi:hypothetical protein
MAIHVKLTTRGGAEPAKAPAAAPRRELSEEEKATRKTRVAAAKDALKRSAGTRGDHVPSARAALKSYLRRLNEPDQPNDDTFTALLEAPFRAPPKKKERH